MHGDYSTYLEFSSYRNCLLDFKKSSIVYKLINKGQSDTFEWMYLVSILLSILFGLVPLSNEQSINQGSNYTVYFFLLDECKICKDYGPEFNDYFDQYASDKIQFVGIFPNFSSKKENIKNFKDKYGVEFKLKTDYFKKLSNKLGANVLPEVFVYDHDNDVVVYRGRIDDRYVSIAKRKRVIKHYDLKEVLDNISLGKKIKSKRTEAIGCLINYNDNL